MLATIPPELPSVKTMPMLVAFLSVDAHVSAVQMAKDVQDPSQCCWKQ